LADVFILMRFPFESKDAQRLNKHIFETIYFAALTASKEIAEVDGPYSSFQGSPASKGDLQFDLWGVTPDSGLWDWDALKTEIKQHGLRNSLLVAPMPTASTSQILGNNECIEPYTSNLYVRRTLAGEFVTVNKHLLKDLIKLGIWDENMKSQLMAHNGSVQRIRGIPQDIKELYKTVWEMKGKTLIDMAAARGAYVDQSQSFNVHMRNVNFGKLTSMHFYAWKKGLKTGMYYLRTQAAVDATKFTVDAKVAAEASNASAVPKSPAPGKPAPSTPKKSPFGIRRDNPKAVAQSPIQRTKAEREEEESRTIEAWRAERERQREAMICSLENKDACISCGS